MRSPDTAGRDKPASVSFRQVINGMLYKIRTGISWRDLQERYAPWKTVYTRFRRYALDGVFTHALQIQASAAAVAGDHQRSTGRSTANAGRCGSR
ncbi:transposase [Streptomyces chartreusis]|uniref:transposase n=1 Tax=Streptomyces chartreusis TaxID=1969 RepID=UPI002F90CCF8|nr:transposase [Streptomyces chartreusis]